MIGNNPCRSCNYGKMILQKYDREFTPMICDLCEDDGCPDFFKVVIDEKIIIAHREIRGDKLVPGDLYIAKRNTGWQIGKCLKVNLESGWVMSDPPMEIYSYDCHECHKILFIRERLNTTKE